MEPTSQTNTSVGTSTPIPPISKIKYPKQQAAKRGGMIGIYIGLAIVLIQFILSLLYSADGENYFLFMFPLFQGLLVIGLGMVGAIIGRFWHLFVFRVVLIAAVATYVIFNINNFFQFLRDLAEIY